MGVADMDLAIIQARLDSKRLPGKMLLPIDGKPLLRHAWDACAAKFGAANVVIATVVKDAKPIAEALGSDVRVFPYPGKEWDVLSRFHACAHRYLKDPLTRIHRITPDDFPIEPEREVFTLKELDALQANIPKTEMHWREHIGLILPRKGPRNPNGIEINTRKDYELACRLGVDEAA